MDVLYSGFDGLDLALKFNIGGDFAAYLEAKQKEAAAARYDVPGEWEGETFTVASTGGQGGYAFRLDTGLTDEVWFLKRPNARDPWGVRVSAKSAALLAHGLDGWQRKMEATALAFGAEPIPRTTSIARIDLAVDILAPDFELDDDAFVMHSRSNRKAIKEIIQTNGRSGRLTSVTIGKMPGRQVILYDKREEVLTKRKVEWPLVWNARRRQLGQPDLDFSDADSSRVWRVEVRAGKHHLKKHWGVTGWGDLHTSLPHMLETTRDVVRYCAPSPDSNRSRWPIHELWSVAQTELLDRLALRPPCIDPVTIRHETALDKIEVLTSQCTGILIGIAALKGVEASHFQTFLAETTTRVSNNVQYHPQPLQDRLARAADRYASLTQDQR
ncbi:hypothetical protein [Jannaschia formosa]|uniref:hypothetical protein n=1 Tax=Jannaschia formosa TaxID=2259592 RepID=UPI000E1BB792|nr:hypothetical protein [Jannaschia formosa]TFL15948.1 hypothetical protein DR046_22675 [Jannaschia formosa]